MSLRKLLLVFGALTVTASVASCAETTHSNAVWLGHGFVVSDAVVQDVPRTAAFMREHQVDYWFINMGVLGKDGRFGKGAATFPRVRQFLAAADSWERTNGHRFKIFAWLNGTTDKTSARYIDLGDTGVRTAMLEECKRLVDPTRADSFVTGTPRTFDGVQFDLEPSGMDEARFANLRLFMRDLKTAIGQDKLTSFTAHKMGVNKGQYWWSPEFVYQMGQDLDVLCMMSYDTGIKDANEYQKWMSDQTYDSLRAVSGAYWNNDAAHMTPLRGSKLFIGFPGFPPNNWHEVTAETTAAAAKGTHQGLERLQQEKADVPLSYFGGAALYLYTDGSGKDKYSSPKDWAEFRTEWLRK